jgi:hypothetical protein
MEFVFVCLFGITMGYHFIPDLSIPMANLYVLVPKQIFK